MEGRAVAPWTAGRGCALVEGMRPAERVACVGAG